MARPTPAQQRISATRSEIDLGRKHAEVKRWNEARRRIGERFSRLSGYAWDDAYGEALTEKADDIESIVDYMWGEPGATSWRCARRSIGRYRS